MVLSFQLPVFKLNLGNKDSLLTFKIRFQTCLFNLELDQVLHVINSCLLSPVLCVCPVFDPSRSLLFTSSWFYSQAEAVHPLFPPFKGWPVCLQ